MLVRKESHANSAANEKNLMQLRKPKHDTYLLI